MRNLKSNHPIIIFKGLFIFLTSFSLMLISIENSFAQSQMQVVRMAKLKIDPTQLELYKTLLKHSLGDWSFGSQCCF
jgi:hypothetical protein